MTRQVRVGSLDIAMAGARTPEQILERVLGRPAPAPISLAQVGEYALVYFVVRGYQAIHVASTPGLVDDVGRWRDARYNAEAITV